MSTRSKFIIGIIVLFTVFLIAEYRMPRKFQWVPTFSHKDPQPFGCMVFDSVLAASMPHGYTVERRTLWQMEKDSVFKEPKAVMIVTKEDIDAQIKKVLELASSGNTLVATTDLYRWADTLGIGSSYNKSFQLSEIAGKNPKKGLLLWKNDTLSQWRVYVQMIERTMEIPDSIDCEVLASFFGNTGKTKNKNALPVVAASFRIGDGELILVSSPLLLTNYMMLSGDGYLFVARLMDRLKHLPVIRTESYMSGTAQTEQTPLYVLLKEPPLRWAVYLAMLTILLFMPEPQNGNLEFARLIGSLYWQQHDNASLLAKKLAYTAEELRRQTGIDITAISDLPVSDLRFNTGRDPEELRMLLKNIQQAASGDYAVSDQELKTYIDELDNLITSM